MVEEAAPTPPEEVRHPDGRIEHPSVHWERTDISPRGVLLVMGAALVIFAAEFYAVWWFFGDYNHYEAAIKPSPFPLAPGPSTQLPAEPRLEQVDRMANIETPNVFLREGKKEQRLASFGPTAEKGFVHIPIERAMKAVVPTLPVREGKPSGQVKNNGLVDGGGPNSGRRFQEGGR